LGVGAGVGFGGGGFLKFWSAVYVDAANPEILRVTSPVSKIDFKDLE